MSFREKSAWVSFICILVIFGVYFTAVGMAMTGRIDGAFIGRLFFALVAVLVILQVALHLVLAMRSPMEAKTPRDERERLIALRADRVGWYTLMVGVLLAIYSIHWGASVRDMAHAALLAFVLAQLARHGTEIALHRRDA